MLLSQQSLIGNIETDHGQWPSGLKHDLSSFGIVVDVGLRCGIYVSAGNTATHEDDFPYQRNNRRVLLDGERDIGQWTNGNQRDLVWRRMHQLNYQIRGKKSVNLAFAG